MDSLPLRSRFFRPAVAAAIAIGILSVGPHGIPDAEANTFRRDLRGGYSGLGQIIVTNSNTDRRQILSGRTTVSIRIRNKGRALTVRVSGRYENNTGAGQLRTKYSFGRTGGARFSFRESVTRSTGSVRGTSNIRRSGVRFTMSGRAYGNPGTLNGAIRIVRGTLRLEQRFSAVNGDRVEWLYIAPKR